MSQRVTGRCAGAFFLLAFVAYGIGSALAGRPAGVALVALNSVMVAAIGMLAFRALRRPHPGAAWTYLVARGAEAFLLTAGVVLLNSAGADAADIAYQLAMLSLGMGSLPFCLALGRQGWLPRWLTVWGFVGYALLAIGTAAELMGAAVGLVLAVPGGLFEIAFALLLLARGFTPSTVAHSGTAGDGASSAAAAVDGGSRPRAALAAGLGLLLMAVLAGLANFGVVQRLVSADATETTTRLLSHQRELVLAAAALFTVVCLDVLVAWALRAFLAGTHRAVALLSAWCRTAYAVVFAVAITHLIAAAGLLRAGARTDQTSPGVYARIADFQEIWSLGLILFGVHLLMIGWLAWRSDAVPNWVAVLVTIAGAGYLADSIGALAPAAYPFQVAAVTFVGEVVLMAWLLVFAARSRGHRRSDLDGDRARQAQPRETGTRVGVPARAMPLAG
ncbi:hypothetical protein MCAG_00617 [Micromonospora sp. ATCC 39149]|uniref:DUF4386 domain-containing protein n=1 Tax=Micromonospora carbonacea TaxID=47853 RepID=A0A7D6C5P6_9ACTN|nr:DUF4386 domain-containing protein [Micromonospora sp. ATCC 39149]EEP70290.1 hypothetical protein MCAG_00617 [Micromonospora sp. ATCC 39149]QLJ96707.1 DUF4386 domain-containing protein [Micromonospora carbonacea]